MSYAQARSVQQRPAEGKNLGSILALCVSIYGKAEEIYRELGDHSQGLGLSNFWANMCLDMRQFAIYWQKMWDLAKARQVAETLERPQEILADLKSIESQLTTLGSSAKTAATHSEAFLLAYAVEFHLLSQGLDTLDDSLLKLNRTALPSKNSKKHLDNFVGGFTRHFGSVQHLALPRSLQRIHAQNRKILNQNMLDPASGVLNRKGLDKSIPPLASLAQRNEYNVAVLLMSIDNIDELYDDLGCDEGDGIVKSIASGIRTVTRVSDLVGRYDYRAFLIFFSQVKHQFLNDVAARILLTLHTRTPHSFKFSLSVGGSYGPLDGSISVAVSQLVRKAEYCLSRARLLRKDKIIIE